MGDYGFDDLKKIQNYGCRLWYHESLFGLKANNIYMVLWGLKQMISKLISNPGVKVCLAP